MTSPRPPADAATLDRWYRQMVEIRLFEEKVQELFMTGQIQGTTHLCQGQEAVSVGSIAAMAAGRRPDQHVPRPRRGARAGHGRRGRVRGADGPKSPAARRASAARCTSSTSRTATSAPTPSSAPALPSRSARPWRFKLQRRAERRAHVLRRRRRRTSAPSTSRSTWRPSGRPRSCSSSPTTCTASTRRCARRPPSTTWPGAPTRSACRASSSTARTSRPCTPRSPRRSSGRAPATARACWR